MDRFYQTPPVYEAVADKCNELKRQYSGVRLFSIGKSVLGRKIQALGIGNLKNATLFVAAVHAQEWLTTLLVLRFFEQLCQEYHAGREWMEVNLKKVFAERGLVVVPMANPDGVEIALNGAKSAKHLRRQVEGMLARSTRSWQANARGVDLNHNFDAGFGILRKMEIDSGIIGPCERQFGGYQPNSEPETKALVSVCTGLNIQKVLAFHSQGEEIFYSYGEKTPKNARIMADALAASSGYRVISPTGLASHGGLKDWFIDKTGRNGFTIEIGRGENPLPVENLEPVYAKICEMMLMSIFL